MAFLFSFKLNPCYLHIRLLLDSAAKFLTPWIYCL